MQPYRLNSLKLQKTIFLLETLDFFIVNTRFWIKALIFVMKGAQNQGKKKLNAYSFQREILISMFF